MSSITQMLDDCKSEVELRNFVEAQMKTMTTIMKKNKDLIEEVEHLKSLVAGAVPIIKSNKSSDLDVESDQMEIAKIEIRKLRDRSYEAVLTLEEAKRLEIYTKILSSGPEKSKQGEREVKELDSNSLLELVSSSETKES